MRERRQFTIREMATLLEYRQMNNQPTVLLLGARTGRLFRSDRFYDHLQKFSDRTFYQLSRTEQFAECYSILANPIFSEIDIYSILRASLENLTVSKADACLAELVQNGHFDEIIYTNIDDMVEDAFNQAEMKEGRDYEVFIAGRDPVRDKKNARCRLIKIYGDLLSRVYTINGRFSYLDKHQELKEFLQRLLSRDILIIGTDPKWDEDIIRAIPGASSGSIWFVSEEEHVPAGILQERQTLSVTGKEGMYESFVNALHVCLYGGVPINYQLVLDLSNRLLDMQHQLQTLQERDKAILQEVQEGHKALLQEVKVIREELGRLLPHEPEC